MREMLFVIERSLNIAADVRRLKLQSYFKGPASSLRLLRGNRSSGLGPRASRPQLPNAAEPPQSRGNHLTPVEAAGSVLKNAQSAFSSTSSI
jgi:hypothetical protein